MGDRDSMWGGTTASGSSASSFYGSDTTTTGVGDWHTKEADNQQEIKFPETIKLGREASIDDLLEHIQ